MSKRHKGNTRHKKLKKREKYVNDFYAREQQLNHLINDFVYCVKHHNLLSIAEYEKMDKSAKFKSKLYRRDFTD